MELVEKYIESNKLVEINNAYMTENGKLQETILKRLSEDTLVYQLKLINFKQYFDLSGNEDMMKFITENGEGVVYPNDADVISFSIRICVNSVISPIIAYSSLKIMEMEPNEKIILKSMKYKESATTEISPMIGSFILKNPISILRDILSSNKEIFQISQEDMLKTDIFAVKRVFYLITIENIVEVENKAVVLNNQQCYKSLLREGLGRICPWENSICLLLVKVEHEDEGGLEKKEIFNNYLNYNYTSEVLDELKNELLVIPNYSIYIQNCAETVLKNYLMKNYKIELYSEESKHFYYDSYSLKLPGFITDYLRTMKIFETVELKYQGEIEYLQIEDLKLINAKGKFTFMFTLLNFQENPFVFEEVSNEKDRILKIEDYKNLANSYFSAGLLEMSLKLNKSIIDDLIRKINLQKQRVEIDFQLKDNEELQNVLSKIHSNLILILYKQGKNLECRESIYLFKEYYMISVTKQNNTYTKILNIEFEIHLAFLELELARDVMSELTSNEKSKGEDNLESKQPLGILEQKLKEVKDMIAKSKVKKNVMVKKMFTFND